MGYAFSVIIFMTHGCLGWKKVTPVLVPKRYISKVEQMGYAIIIVLGLVYLSFPLYVTLEPAFGGYETSLQEPLSRVPDASPGRAWSPCRCGTSLGSLGL